MSAKLCLDLKLTWAVLSAVRSHEENSFSSKDGPKGRIRNKLLYNQYHFLISLLHLFI